MSDFEPYVTMEEIKKYIPVSSTTIKRLCSDPRDPMPHSRLRTIYTFRVSRVLAWLDAREVSPRRSTALSMRS